MGEREGHRREKERDIVRTMRGIYLGEGEGYIRKKKGTQLGKGEGNSREK